jgi:hypothetical protein
MKRAVGLVRRFLRLSAPIETTSGESLDPYVYVEGDGTAREIHADERTYLETEFDWADGARPYIKSNYKQRDGGGELSGYLKRSKLPVGTSIKPAPAEDPHSPLIRAEYIEDLRAKGLEVTENPDGTFTGGRVVYHWVDEDDASNQPRESGRLT